MKILTITGTRTLLVACQAFFPPPSFSSSLTFIPTLMNTSWACPMSQAEGWRLEEQWQVEPTEFLPLAWEVEGNPPRDTHTDECQVPLCFVEPFETIMTMKVPVVRTRGTLKHTQHGAHNVRAFFVTLKSIWKCGAQKYSPSVGRTTWETAKSYPEVCFKMMESKQGVTEVNWMFKGIRLRLSTTCRKWLCH